MRYTVKMGLRVIVCLPPCLANMKNIWELRLPGVISVANCEKSMKHDLRVKKRMHRLALSLRV